MYIFNQSTTTIAPLHQGALNMNNAVGMLEGRDAELQRVALLHLVAVSRLPMLRKGVSRG
jgi:hypothetical protein